LNSHSGTLALAQDVLPKKLPSADDPAFNPDDGGRWSEVRQAHEQIQGMFWGERLTLEAACGAIRDWIRTELAAPASL
jgi:hypothetical protein